MTKRWKFEVTENGQWVAGGDCTDERTAVREAGHYVMMYGQDGGEVQALVWSGRKPRQKKPKCECGGLGYSDRPCERCGGDF